MDPCVCDHGDTVEKLSKTVYGNGEPQKALVTQVVLQASQLEAIERRIARVEKIGWALIVLVLMAVGEQFLDMVKVQVPVPVPAFVEASH